MTADKRIKAMLISMLKRFPLTMSCCVFNCVFSHFLWFSINIFWERTSVVVLLCFCGWAFICDMYAERNQLSAPLRLIGFVIGITSIVSIIYCLTSSEYAEYTNAMLLLGGLFVLAFTAPFIAKNTKPLEVWNFQYNLLKQLCATILAAAALIAIINFLYFSIETLFGIMFSLKLRVCIFPFIGFVLCPIICISGIPDLNIAGNDNNIRLLSKQRYFEEFIGAYGAQDRSVHVVHEDPSTEATQKLPKERMFRKKSIDPMRDINFIRNALNYVVIPFLLTYSVILYMYIVQIIFKQSLPEGIVATLVCIFGDIGIATYLVGYRFKNYNKVFSFFTSNFFKIFLMPTFMLAIAIGLRIDEYGITISRYMIVISFIWFQICIFSSFFLKEECVGQCIVTSLALLIIASSFPRIGAVDVSEWSRKCKWDKWEQKMV